MKNSLIAAKALQESFDRLGPVQLHVARAASDLDPQALLLVRRGVRELPVEVRDLADQILDEWGSLPTVARTAALLALAEALAQA
jgi:hypothetical protein